MNNLEFAINMEIEGRRFYLEQAEKNKKNELHPVFMILADSELEHADLLIKRMNREAYSLTDAKAFTGFESVFHGLGDISNEIRAPRQLDAYRMAVLQEKKSIKLYEEMLMHADNPEDKELFKFLIDQENQHLLLFEDLVILLTRPEEWVESAEFGIREEY